MKLSKAYKAEHYDEINAERDKLSLALFDLVNGKFSKPVTIRENDYCTGYKPNGVMTMRVSWRGMPIFLVEWTCTTNNHKVASVYTETELEDVSRQADCSSHYRMLRDAFIKLKTVEYPKTA